MIPNEVLIEELLQQAAGSSQTGYGTH